MVDLLGDSSHHVRSLEHFYHLRRPALTSLAERNGVLGEGAGVQYTCSLGMQHVRMISSDPNLIVSWIFPSDGYAAIVAHHTQILVYLHGWFSELVLILHPSL